MNEPKPNKLSAAVKRLFELGKSPNELALEKRQRVAYFLNEFRFSTASHIQYSARSPGWILRGENPGSGLAKKLEDEGLLRSFEGGKRIGRLFSLTPAGLDYVDGELRYAEFDPTKLGHSTIDHSLAVQRLVLIALGRDFATSFRGERGSEPDQPGAKRPDARLVRENGEIWMVEVERSLKKSREMDILTAACSTHREIGYEGVIVAFEDRSLLNRYIHEFRQCQQIVRIWTHSRYDGWTSIRKQVEPGAWNSVFLGLIDEWENIHPLNGTLSLDWVIVAPWLRQI